MKKDVQKIVLGLAALVFGGFLVSYVLGMSSGIIAFGTLSPVLLLFNLFLGTVEEEKEIPMDAEDKKEEDHDRPHVDLLIDQLAERREQLEKKTKDLDEAETKLEGISQRVLALESENMELSGELDAIRSQREGLHRELEEARNDLKAQVDKVKDASISILPIRDEEEAKILNISEAAEAVVNEMAALTDKADINVKVVKPSKALLVKADPRMIDILFKNIIDNTIKYMQRSGTFQITISDIGEDLFIVMKDSGEGLDPEETQHIFELNYQGSNRISGNGLGLAQARAIVEYYGGMIYARSTKGNGMGIYIHLPSAH